MAKKKGGKKGGAGKRYKGTPAKRATNGSGARLKAREAKPRKKAPASIPLPGMEQIRDAALDRLCEQIGECRDQMNQAKRDEASLDASALQRMSRSSEKFPTGRTVYRHAGVELARIPGADKLRVRVTKETGDADDEDQVGDDRRDAVEELGDQTDGDHQAAASEG
jgi:hypothetical protein